VNPLTKQGLADCQSIAIATPRTQYRAIATLLGDYPLICGERQCAMSICALKMPFVQEMVALYCLLTDGS
jgi:hypothetical protein